LPHSAVMLDQSGPLAWADWPGSSEPAPRPEPPETIPALFSFSFLTFPREFLPHAV
jgi:hypothetical protein